MKKELDEVSDLKMQVGVLEVEKMTLEKKLKRSREEVVCLKCKLDQAQKDLDSLLRIVKGWYDR